MHCTSRVGRTLLSSLLAAGVLAALQGAVFIQAAEAKGGAKSAFARKYLSHHGYSGDPRGADAPTGAGGGINTLATVQVTATYVSPIAPRMDYSHHWMGANGIGRFISTRTSAEQESDYRLGCPEDETAGNPVVLYSGNKVESELDFGSAGEMALFLQRTYNHHWSATGIFGEHWISNFDYSLAFSGAGAIAWVQYPDGRRIKFLRVGSSNRWNEDKAHPVAYLLQNGDNTHTVYNEVGGSETFNAEGYVIRLQNEQGVAWDFSYNNKYLQRVTHASGRTIQFGWNNGQLTQVTDPAGSVYTYTYTPNVFGQGRSRLASTTLPGDPATTLTYHYEDARLPGALTGKSINGTRYSTFAYDANGRTVRTEHQGGIERHQFSYSIQATQQVIRPPAPIRPGGALAGEIPGWCEHGPDGRICYVPWSLPGGGAVSLGAAQKAGTARTQTTASSIERPTRMSVTVTNPLGRATTHTYEDGRKVSVEGAASPRCPASYKAQTYDANGYPDLVHDFENNLIDFDYNAEGQLLTMTEAAGTQLARTTRYTWETGRNRLQKEVVEGVEETEYSYDTRGNVSAETVRDLTGIAAAEARQQTTLFSYQYHANGLTASATIDGPLPQDTLTLRYNAQGDLVGETNGLGHAVSYAGHNGRGQPGLIVGVNGERTEITYDARGRVIATRQQTDGGWATTRIGYDAAGNVGSVTAADGTTTHYGYDSGMRRVSETVALGDGTYRWTQHRHDVASNRTRTEVRHTDFPFGTTVTGRINGVTHDANWNWSIVGWACTTGSTSPISVQATTQSGHALVDGMANHASEPGVGSACQSNGTAHRFTLPISLAQRQQLGGQRVVVQGLSPLGAAQNATLGDSNIHAIPAAPVTGSITGIVRDDQWNWFVDGWGCSIGVPSPIDVHIYLGGAAGAGTYVGAARADLATGTDVANACQTNHHAYRFRFHLNDSLRNAHANQAIFVHGISPAGGQNLLLANSGGHVVPAIVRTADFLSFTPSPSRIDNGEQSVLTAHLRNTGNVPWNSDIYLTWGSGSFTDSRPLPHAVMPGQDVVVRWHVSPLNRGTGVTRVMYMASLAQGPTAWGPRGNTGVDVENLRPVCKPGSPVCNEPWRIEDPLNPVDAEGAN